MDIAVDQHLRDIQRQYLDFLDDDVRYFLVCYFQNECVCPYDV